MSATTKLLEEAGQHLARAEALLGRAGEELGPPFAEPLSILAGDVQRLRRRARNAATTTGTTRA